ncbi:hypothetical protein JXO52_15535 [bacterium]|nr:hypothetical protein [bacterium]
MKQTTLLLVTPLLLLSCSGQPPGKRIITSPDAPAAIGLYSQAVQFGGRIYLSGQLGIDPETGTFAGSDFVSQARQALTNQKAVLESAAFTLHDVVQCQVFLTDMDNYRDFNTVYNEFFTAAFPARAVLEVSRIPAGGLVEIMMIAEH